MLPNTGSDRIIEMAEFVVASTQLGATPHVPEIRLHLAAESLRLWESIERKVGAQVAKPPYWAFAWPGGQALARYVLDHPQLVAGRRILDLASGSGISAIAAAKAGATRVIAADTDPFALIAIIINADANGVAVEPTAIDLLSDGADFDLASVDVVLAGDIFYHPQTGMHAFRFMQRCRAAGALIFVGDPGRVHLPRQALVRRCEYAVPVTRSVQYSAASTDELSDTDLIPTAVWELDSAQPAAASAQAVPL